MKIRNGFVSNSSSSSFLVIKKLKNIPEFYLTNCELNVPEDFGGEEEFGWQTEKYYDFGSKLNFAYIQARDSSNPKHMKLLEKVLYKHLKVSKINWNVTGYIDHQSSIRANENDEIFESEQMLINFLFNEKSYIDNSNDNGGRD